MKKNKGGKHICSFLWMQLVNLLTVRTISQNLSKIQESSFLGIKREKWCSIQKERMVAKTHQPHIMGLLELVR